MPLNSVRITTEYWLPNHSLFPLVHSVCVENAKRKSSGWAFCLWNNMCLCGAESILACLLPLHHLYKLEYWKKWTDWSPLVSLRKQSKTKNSHPAKAVVMNLGQQQLWLACTQKHEWICVWSIFTLSISFLMLTSRPTTLILNLVFFFCLLSSTFWWDCFTFAVLCCFSFFSQKLLACNLGTFYITLWE